jgi:hypothetical protein
VLYRLPALIAAVKSGKQVLITEGERDADTAVALGFAATTMPGGINKWFALYDEFFRDADIVIVSDNDPQAKDPKTGALQAHSDGRPVRVGQDHAAKLARRLCKVAKHVRSIIFPQKDLTAWREAGGTRAALEALIGDAPDLIRQPDLDPPPPDAEEKDNVLAELNLDNAVVIIGARTRVLRYEDTPHEAGGERYTYRIPTYLPFDDFRNFYLNRYIVGKDGDPTSIGSWWLANPRRKQYRGVVFIPGRDPVVEGRLNLWTGFSIHPQRGEWPRMREHIFQVLAAREDAVDLYIMNWLAFAAQHPDKQAEVALVLLGGIGTGKSLLGRAMCRIFGQHARHISSPEHLTGRFNSHFQQCCFLFADEAYAPQDKRAEGVLKRLITEDTIHIEPKGVNPFEVPNYLHVMMASNQEWVVPAGVRERRYQVQEVAGAHQQDPAWFEPLHREMRNGGLQAMLYDLRDRNLGDWHPRQIIRTKALGKQQEESLPPLDQWWLELLQTAVLEGTASKYAPDKAISNRYEVELSESVGFGETRKRTVWRDGLFDQARRISPRLKGVSDAALGRYLTDQRCANAWVRGGGRGRRGWRFPPLGECRSNWMSRFPETVWRDPNTTEWTSGEDEEAPRHGF